MATRKSTRAVSAQAKKAVKEAISETAVVKEEVKAADTCFFAGIYITQTTRKGHKYTCLQSSLYLTYDSRRQNVINIIR